MLTGLIPKQFTPTFVGPSAKVGGLPPFHKESTVQLRMTRDHEIYLDGIHKSCLKKDEVIETNADAARVLLQEHAAIELKAQVTKPAAVETKAEQPPVPAVPSKPAKPLKIKK